MRLFAKLTGVVLAVFVLGGFAAATASADGTVTGTMEGDGPIGDIGPCDFEIDYDGTPPSSVTLVGSTFGPWAGGPNDGCDTATIDSVSDVDVDFTQVGASYRATLNAPIEIEVNDPNCTYTVSSDILTNLSSSPFGPYTGSGGATGSGICFFNPATLTVSGAVFDED